MTEKTMHKKIAAIRAHALDNYNKGGWDILVECWSDADIEEEIEGCRTTASAIRRIGRSSERSMNIGAR